MSEPVLCYIEEPWAFFTTQPLDKQWGDDWDDAPYEHNAERPYRPLRDGESWSIIQIAFEGQFETPASFHWNSPWSVQAINAGATPWLIHVESGSSINAGAHVDDFINYILECGGMVYLPLTLEGK